MPVLSHMRVLPQNTPHARYARTNEKETLRTYCASCLSLHVMHVLLACSRCVYCRILCIVLRVKLVNPCITLLHVMPVVCCHLVKRFLHDIRV